MKKYYFSLMMTVLSSALVTSCLNDDDSGSKRPQTIAITEGLYVVNSGSQGQDNGSLTYFDYPTLQAKQLLAGASGLGEMPSDAYTKGDTIFVVGSAKNTIFAINKKDFRIIAAVSTTEGMGEAEGNNPRRITGYGDNLYFTTYGGYVGIMNANTLKILPMKYQVGSAPEGLTVGGTSSAPVLFVCNSDYGKAAGNASISKISLSTGSVETILNEKIQNPQEIVAVNNDLYFLDWGYYAKDSEGNSRQQEAGLYRYSSGKITQLIPDATGMGVGLEYINGYPVGYRIVTFSNPYGSASKPAYNTYSTFTGTRGTLTLSGDSGMEIFSPAAIAVDPITDYIVITSRSKDPESTDENPYASYTLPGYANMYSRDGSYIKDTHFQTGIEPHTIGFLTGTMTIGNTTNR